MAQTILEIQEAIIAEKEAELELAGLTSPSKTAIWRLWIYLTAVAIWIQQQYFDAYLIALQALLDSRILGTGKWYASMMLKFQLGDTLVKLPNGSVGYEIIDEEKQIIKRASYAEQTGGVLLLKVAKESGDDIIPLTAEELTQADGYLDKFKFAGVKTQLISEESDKLRTTINVYYNAIITLADLKDAVEAAITLYLKNIDFDGNVYASKIMDAIQAVEGVEDVFITQLVGVSTLGNTTFNRIYRARAGYIKPDDTPGFTMDDLITYIAQ